MANETHPDPAVVARLRKRASSYGLGIGPSLALLDCIDAGARLAAEARLVSEKCAKTIPVTTLELVRLEMRLLQWTAAVTALVGREGVTNAI